MKKVPSIHICILFAFLANMIGPLPMAQADEFRLPAPGAMVHLSPPLDPPMLKGIKVHPDNPFRFDFILDQGDEKRGHFEAAPKVSPFLKQESTRLIKYFLASLTIPEKDLWVNLSPYEKDRIIPQSFGLTEMGRDLLAEDYMLKQITASLIYPEDQIGKKFWKRIYEEAAKKFGTTNIPVNTFNKVWIVPEKAVVYENAKAGTAYVVESKLKVMLEQDYLALSRHSEPQYLSRHSEPRRGEESLKEQPPGSSLRDSSASPQNDVNALGSQIVREIVIPELTKEVNEGKNFSQLRQVYNSLILATWYKRKIQDSILSQVYTDKNKTTGVQYTSTVIPAKIGVKFKNDVEGLYREYLKAFKKGVYNYIKEEYDPVTQETIPRKYFSGGMTFLDMAMMTETGSLPNPALLNISGYLQMIVDVRPWSSRHSRLDFAGPLPQAATIIVPGKSKPAIILGTPEMKSSREADRVYDRAFAAHVRQFLDKYGPLADAKKQFPKPEDISKPREIVTDPILVGLENYVDINGKIKQRIVWRESAVNRTMLSRLVSQSIAHWGAENDVLNIPAELIRRMLNHPPAQGRTQAERFRNALRNPLIDIAVGSANGLVDPARGVIVLRPGADRFVALHEAAEGIIRARFAMRHGVDPNDPIAMAKFFREHPELGEQAHQRAHQIEERARDKYQSQRRIRIIIDRFNRAIARMEREALMNAKAEYNVETNKVRMFSYAENVNMAKNIESIRKMEEFNKAVEKIKPIFINHILLFEINALLNDEDEDYEEKRKDLLWLMGDHAPHPAGVLLPAPLKKMMGIYDIDFVRIADKDFDHFAGRAIKDIGNLVAFAVPPARFIAIPEVIDNGGLGHLIFVIGHEVGHVLDYKRGIGEILAYEDDQTFLQVMDMGKERWGDEWKGVEDIEQWRNFLQEGALAEENKATETLVTAIGNWLIDPNKFAKSHPKADSFFRDLIPETSAESANQTSDSTQVPAHWGANNGGIDFKADKVLNVFLVKNSGGEVKFHIDPAMLRQLQNAPGFVPVIINIQPLKSLPDFLGIRETAGNSQGMG